jgi:PEGA domain-containing protein
MNRAHRHAVVILLFCTSLSSFAKDPPGQVITWPEQGPGILRFTFGKFKEVGSLGGQRTFVTDTTAENLWSKTIQNATFSLYLYDRNKVRIGEAMVNVSNIGPGETVKFQTTIASSGPPMSLTLSPRYLPKELGPAAPPRTISMTVNTVPQGATANLDGIEVGTTPKMVQVSVGKHLLEFKKEGFNAGRFPFEIGSEDVSGGSVSFELGTSAHDTVELRDGSVLSGDLVSISGMDVIIRIGGAEQHFDRNQVKRILFVQRQAAEQNL